MIIPGSLGYLRASSPITANRLLLVPFEPACLQAHPVQASGIMSVGLPASLTPVTTAHHYSPLLTNKPITTGGAVRAPLIKPDKTLLKIMMTHRLSRLFITGAAITVTSTACANHLTDYSQITLQAIAPDSSAEISPELLTETQAVLERRLASLGIDSAEVETIAPDKLTIRLPLTVNPDTTKALLAKPGRLSLRPQKPDTTEALADSIETLQRLLVDQNTLTQSGQIPQAAALQSQIDDTRNTIIGLFEPTVMGGQHLTNAIATAAEREADIWEVGIRFDQQGAEIFAKQTQQLAGTERAMGIFLDDVLLSAPTIGKAYAETGIEGGSAVIAGSFTATAAQELAMILQSGALPIELKTIEVLPSTSKS